MSKGLPAMAYGDKTYSSNSIKEEAEALGYRYTDFEHTSTSAGDGDTVLYEGRIGLQSLPCGVTLCSSDLRALHDSENEGVIQRSLNMMLFLECDPSDVEFGEGNRFRFNSGDAAIACVADHARILGRMRAGEQSRSLLVRVRPEDFADADIARQIEDAICTTSFGKYLMPRRVLMLAHELAAPTVQGGVGRLLAESLALEMVARVLLITGKGSEQPHCKMSSRDYAKVMMVRDAIISNPAVNYTLEGLASEAGLSVSALKAKFPMAFGRPVFAFLRDARMELAREGIQQEGWTIAQAAYFTGYNHQSNFTAAFRRKFGMAPSALKP